MRKILFVDRDGTLIEAPTGGPIDDPAKVRLMPGVVPALLALQQSGFELVLVSNQGSIGSGELSHEAFERTEDWLVTLLESQGIRFAERRYCPHRADEGCGCRKPAPGLVHDLIAGNTLDRAASAVVGDRESDLEFARNIGVAGIRIGAGGDTWAQITHRLINRPRTANVRRKTRETDVEVTIDLDQRSDPQAHTGIAFFDHMLEQLGKHGGFCLSVRCAGDLDVDEHHTVEDVALALGAALREALGDKRGIQRYGFLLPMDESEAQVSIDLGGRPYLVFDGEFPREQVGGLPTELVPHFFRSLADALGCALHIRVRGENAHHMVEASFKAVARALRQALTREGSELPTTKGRL
jgi:imidazoleglycerol-phosphate dehydratase / histidinol-phosphatase